MDKGSKEKLLQNLVAASLVAGLALLVATVAYFLDRAESLRDQAYLTQASGSSSIGRPIRVSDSAFKRIYPVTRKDRLFYGVVAVLGDRSGRAKVALMFTKDATLDSATLLEAFPSDIAFAREGWFKEFLGKGGRHSLPLSKSDLRNAEAVSGATESFGNTAILIGRLSSIVQRTAEGGQGGGQ
jgi:hypothetical protein